MENQAVRKSKRLKEKHTKTTTENEIKSLPEKSNVISDESDKSEIPRPKRKFIGSRKVPVKAKISTKVDIDELASNCSMEGNLDTNDSGSDVEQNLSRKNKRSKRKRITLSKIESDSSSEKNEESTAPHSSMINNNSKTLRNININSANNIDKGIGSDTECSLPEPRTCEKLKRIKVMVSEEEEEEDNIFKTPTKEKLDAEIPTSSVKRSLRLKEKSESLFALPSRSRILDDIESTPFREKDVRYYKQKRGMQQNNLVKWFVFFVFFLSCSFFPLSHLY